MRRSAVRFRMAPPFFDHQFLLPSVFYLLLFDSTHQITRTHPQMFMLKKNKSFQFKSVFLKKNLKFPLTFLIAILGATDRMGSIIAADYTLKPVAFNKVKMTGDFWRPRLETQRNTLVPFAFKRTEPGAAHLRAARDFLAGKETENHRPHRFIDSDLYKVMEGAAYLLQLRRDPELEDKFDELSRLIEGAQEENGYLYPSHTTGVGGTKHMMGDSPYEFVVHSHELYNVGHLYEAAIAYFQATGKSKLLKVAEKSARHINQVFFVGDPKYNNGKPIRQAPGHQELELALVKLYRATGKSLYLDMAKRFLAIRGVTYVPDGEGVMAPTYAQQHAPVNEQSEAVGHAVRATYMYSAMADVGTLTGQPEYQKALSRIWGDIVNTRMHITGGLGAVHGIEGFGPQYELPNADAFNETCAAVGNVMFNYRMFLLHKDARYLDVAEIALLNNVLAAVNLDGNRFFYVNPLDSDGKYPFNHGTAGRAPWFGTACCPSNLARLVPQVPGMIYAHDNHDIYVTFYANCETEIKLDAVQIKLEQNTNYPNDGKITLNVNPSHQKRFRVLLRIPTWAREQFVPGELYSYTDPVMEAFELKVNGMKVPVKSNRGFLAVERVWDAGDRLELTLPMQIRVTKCHPNVKSNRNRVSFTRGPLVLCAEGVDNGGATQRFFLENVKNITSAELHKKSINAGTFLQIKVDAQAVTADGRVEDSELVLTPYYAWNNRGVSSMTVWFPRNKELAVFDPNLLPAKSIFSRVIASHTFNEDTVVAVGDKKEPRNSGGRKVPRWTSRPEKGKAQWVEARFHESKRLRNVGVYWMQDHSDVKFPAEWFLEIRQDGEWQPLELYVTDHYETRANQYNVVRPAASVQCDAIRLQMTPREDACLGILELRADFEIE